MISLTRLCRSPRGYSHSEGAGRAVRGHRRETWVVETGQQSQLEVCRRKPRYLGGKAVGNPTMTWVEELWEFRLRRDKGCLRGPCAGGVRRGLGRGQRGQDFQRRRRWVTFPTSLAEAPRTLQCVRDWTARGRVGKWVQHRRWGGALPHRVWWLPWWNPSKVPLLWLRCSPSSADVPMTPFIKMQSKQTRKKKKEKVQDRCCYQVAFWLNWEVFSVSPLYLSLLTDSAAEGTGLGLPACCSVLRVLVSLQSVVWCTWRRWRMAFGMFGAAHRLQERSYFFLYEQSQITSTFLDVFFKYLSSLLLHLLMCFQMLFARLAVPANELQLLWGERPWGSCGPAGNVCFCLNMPFFLHFFPEYKA